MHYLLTSWAIAGVDELAKQIDSFREVLRARTRDTHEQLHQHSSFVGLFKQSLGLEDYKALIQRFHGFYVPLEDAILRNESAIYANQTAYRYENRAHHLKSDLLDLGYSPRAIANAPLCKGLQNAISTASLGGVLYVVEGSTLGAASIDRAAQRLLSAEVSDGRRFWAWSRSQNKQRWSSTNQYHETLAENDVALEDLVQGACDTFQALADWLQPLHKADKVAQEVHA